MSSDDRFSFLLAAVLAAGTTLLISRSWSPRAPGLPDPPRLGCVAGAAMTGPPIEEPDAAGGAAPGSIEVRASESLGSKPWPEFARRVVFHPLIGDVVDPEGLEQGSPYHLVIEPDGSVRWTARGVAGAPAAPPGLPVAWALQALHVALPGAGRIGAGRSAAVGTIWRAAATRLGDDAVLFADEVPGADVIVPDGFDRRAVVPQAQTQPTTSRAASSPTRPGQGDRVEIRLGSAKVDAGIASTVAARAQGFMGRSSLRKDEGLLFVYRVADRRSFWMKGTLVPLDILYLADDGTVLGLRTLSPPDPGRPEADPPRFESPSACRLVLEVAGGSAGRQGIGVGSRVGLPDSVADLFPKADP